MSPLFACEWAALVLKYWLAAALAERNVIGTLSASGRNRRGVSHSLAHLKDDRQSLPLSAS